jgi:hypothetical protein
VTKLLDGAIYILSPCPGRRAIAVAGVRSRKARVHNDRIGRTGSLGRERSHVLGR